uniref:DNA repair/transcription protein met18/mms19 n=1 Tax=Rhizophora mucronata TaxID=61149 RepID=A0A2P2MWW7_RHIMU
MVLLGCILSSGKMDSLSQQASIKKRQFHATMKPLYKQ